MKAWPASTLAASADPAAVPHAALRDYVAQILVSPGFARAPRMRRLLAYFAEQCLAGPARKASEYAIGIAVFDRDGASYNTCDDPIVRVQVGRLRDKLRHYYRDDGRADTLELSIPTGSYALHILPRRCDAAPLPLQIGLQRLQCLTRGGIASAFASGVDEELADCLYQVLGEQISTLQRSPPGAIAMRAPATPGPEVRRLLEGSIRTDVGRVRVALRLADARSSCMLWSRQFDFSPDLSIIAQGHVARSLAASLQEYLHSAAQL